MTAGLRVYDRVAFREGDQLPATIRCWRVEYPFHVVTVSIEGREWSGRATDVFAALVEVRTQLESEGLLLGVEGSRIDSYPSGMQRDQGGGLFTYRMTRGLQSASTDQRETFHPADRASLATVEQQRLFFKRWIASLKHSPLRSIVGPLDFDVDGSAASGYELNSAGGEISWSVSPTVLTDHWSVNRTEGANPSQWLFDAYSFEDARRFLLLNLGGDRRTHLELDWLSIDGESCAPDCQVLNRGERDYLFIRGTLRGVFARSSGQYAANQFSWLADHPVDDLLASYQDPDGMPLLARFVRHTS